MALEVLTIGHSTLSHERFLSLLQQASVTAVADVRTVPYSEYLPHFNRDILKPALAFDRIAYVFLGDALGGRPKDKQFLSNGRADYERMAQSKNFINGLERVLKGAKDYRIALMCSEHDPLDCHRCLLVGRALHERDVRVRHILSSGSLIDHEAIESRLMAISGKTLDDFFDPPAHRLAAAYRDRAMKVAFEEEKPRDQQKSLVGGR